MKIYKFQNNQLLTKDVNELAKSKYQAKAEKGKWYQWRRFYLIKSAKSNDCGFISLNFFERFFARICKINLFNKVFKDKKIIIIPQNAISETIKKIQTATSLKDALPPPPKNRKERTEVTEPSIDELYLSKNWDLIPKMSYDYTKDTSIEDQRKAHESAKTFLSKNLEKLGADVKFISPPPTKVPTLSSIKIDQPLNPKVFSWQATNGVMEDIQKDGQSNTGKKFYGVASQFNGCEAPGKGTVKPGNAVKVYHGDPTQGPKAQLAFDPVQVEIINCGGNLGYNGLCHVLDKQTKDAVITGYLTPISRNVDRVIDQLRNNGHKIEYPSIANIPINGNHPVYQILIAAPAFGAYKIDPLLDLNKQHEVEFLCALHGFRAQFQEAINASHETEPPVILKPVAVGLGAFGNDPDVIAKAFYAAAKEFEAKLAEKNVQVQFQVFEGGGKGRQMANALLLETH